MKRQSKLVIGITGGILLIAVVVIVAVLVASGSDSKKYARHMKSAQRYMDELQYEQAIAEYKAAIEIEPNNVEAYHALAELYVQTGDYKAAVAVLNQGVERLSVCIEEDWVNGVSLRMGIARLSADIEEVQKASEEADLYEEEFGADKEQELIEDNSISEYDEKGNLVKWTDYYPDGTIFKYYIYEYDGSGNLVRETHYNSGGMIDEYFTYEYDGNQVQKTNYRADGTLNSISEYDENGNLLQENYYQADGTTFKYHTCAYDENGSLRQEVYYDVTADEITDYYHISEYDGNGNIVKETYYDRRTTYYSFSFTPILCYFIYEYDGNRVKKTCYHSDWTVWNYYIYEYDGNGNLVKETHYDASGGIDFTDEYDGNGKCVKRTWYHDDGTTSVEVY